MPTPPPDPRPQTPDATSTVTFDKTNPDIADALTECKVGEPEKLLITFTPTEVSDTEVTGTIDSAEYYEAPDEEPDEGPMEAPMKGGMPKALNLNG